MRRPKGYKRQIHNKQTFGSPQSHTAVKFRPSRDGLEPKWLQAALQRNLKAIMMRATEKKKVRGVQLCTK